MDAKDDDMRNQESDIRSVADKQLGEGADALSKGNLEVSIPLLEAAAQLYAELGHSRYFEAIQMLSTAQRLAGDQWKALQSANQLIHIAAKLSNPALEAAGYCLAGAAHFSAGHREEAFDAFELSESKFLDCKHEEGLFVLSQHRSEALEALESFEEILARCHELVARGCAGSAQPLINAVMQALSASHDPRCADACTVMVEACLSIGDIDGARLFAGQIVKIGRKLANVGIEAMGYIQLGDTSCASGKTVEAIEGYEIAASLLQGIGSELAHDVLGRKFAKVLKPKELLQRGEDRLASGRAGEARELLRAAALEFSEADDGHFAAALTALAEADRLTHSIDSSLSSARLLRGLGRDSGSAEMEARGELLIGLALMASDRSERALTHLMRCREILGSIDAPLTAISACIATGNVLSDLGRYEEAESIILGAGEIADTAGNRHSSASVLYALGELYMRMGRFPESRVALRDAEMLFEETGDGLGRANAILDQAELLFHFGQFKDSLVLFSRADSAYASLGNRLGRANMAISQARALGGLGRRDEAAELLREAAEAQGTIGSQMGIGNANAMLGSVLLQLGRTDESRVAFEKAEAAYAKTEAPWSMISLRAERASVLFAINDPVAAIIDGEEAMTLAVEMLSRYRSASIRSEVIEQLGMVASVLHDSRVATGNVAEAVAVAESIRNQTMQLPFRLELPSTDMAFVSWKLDSGQVQQLCEIAVSDGAVVLAWTQPSRDGPLRCLIATPSARPLYLTTQIKLDDIEGPLNTVVGRAREFVPDGWSDALVALRDILMRSPIAAAHDLSGASVEAPESIESILDLHRNSTLKLVANGPLSLIPFSALAQRDAAGDIRYLVEDRALLVAPSLRQLVARDQATAPPPGRALVIGDPANPLRPLPHAESEARDVEEALLGAGAEVMLYGRDTPLSPSRFLTLAPNCDWIHIAAHGLYNASAPFSSYIGLSGADQSEASLRVDELLKARLCGSTVILSACSTGESDWRRMFDSVSLASAFLSAGSSRVLASLWQVNDIATRAFMRIVYGHLLQDGLALADSLRSAQTQFIRGLGDFNASANPVESLTRSPLYWAAFRCFVSSYGEHSL